MTPSLDTVPSSENFQTETRWSILEAVQFKMDGQNFVFVLFCSVLFPFVSFCFLLFSFVSFCFLVFPFYSFVFFCFIKEALYPYVKEGTSLFYAFLLNCPRLQVSVSHDSCFNQRQGLKNNDSHANNASSRCIENKNEFYVFDYIHGNLCSKSGWLGVCDDAIW